MELLCSVLLKYDFLPVTIQYKKKSITNANSANSLRSA